MRLSSSYDLSAVLCYVDGHFAYFTTQALDKQWGDDWDDAPYEHNAEPPYQPCWHREPKHRGEKPLCACPSCVRDWDGDRPRWAIYRVIFQGDFDQPCSNTINSRWSVEQINARAVPWLRSESWVGDPVSIWAGTPLGEFVAIVRRAGGAVFAEVEAEQSVPHASVSPLKQTDDPQDSQTSDDFTGM